MGKEFSIRPGGLEELDAVVALVEALLVELEDEGREFAETDRAKLRTDLEQAMASGRFWALLARDETGTSVGVLTLSASFAIYAGGEYGVIDEMYVKPEYRSQGIGRRLVDAAVEIAAQRRWFRLDVTGPNAIASGRGEPATEGAESGAGEASAPVLRFYRRLGFEPTGQKLRLLVPRPPD